VAPLALQGGVAPVVEDGLPFPEAVLSSQGHQALAILEDMIGRGSSG
jgi:hypothetical protein